MDRNWENIYTNMEEKKLFLRKSWFEAWKDHNNESNNWEHAIYYEKISADEVKEAIIPYTFQNIGPLKFASLVGRFLPHRGIPNNSTDKDLIVKTADRISSITNTDGFRFGFVEDGDKFIVALISELKKRNWKIARKSYGHDYGKTIPNSEEEYLAGLSSSRKSKIKRSRRRFEEAGEAKFIVYTDEEADVWKKVLEDIEDIERNSWVGEGGEPRFMGEKNQAFWNDIISDKWFSKAVKAFVVYLDQKPVCFDFAFDCGKTRYCYDKGFHKEYTKYGLGIQLEIETMKNAIGQGVKYYNQSIGTEEFKVRWGAEKLSELIDVVAFPPTLKGYLISLVVKLKYFFEDYYFKETVRNWKRRLKLKSNN